LLGGDTYIDAAYDKMYWRINDRRFPLRLLSPYAGMPEERFEAFAELIRTKYPRWMPEGT
jgi:hypothetical protein